MHPHPSISIRPAEHAAAHSTTDPPSARQVLLADFRDVLFQSDPFSYHQHEWHPEYQLLLYQGGAA